MSFSSTGLQKIVDAGFLGGMSLWRYSSSDSSTSVAATGYFGACGVGSRSTAPGANVGMRVGDLLANQESSNGATPGRVTWHGVKASTANQASTLASTGYAAGYDCSVASTP